MSIYTGLGISIISAFYCKCEELGEEIITFEAIESSERGVPLGLDTSDMFIAALRPSMLETMWLDKEFKFLGEP